MRFMQTDGGRQFSKRPRQHNDCAVVAVATLLRLPYDEVFEELKRRGRKNNSGFYFPHGDEWGPSHGELLGHWFEFIPIDPTPLPKIASALPNGLVALTIRKSDHVCAVRNGTIWDFHDKKTLEDSLACGLWNYHKMKA